MGFAQNVASRMVSPVVNSAKKQVTDLKDTAGAIKSGARNPKSILRAGLAAKSPAAKRLLKL